MEVEEIKLLIHVYSSLGLHRIVFCSNLSGESRRLCCVAKGHMQKRLPTLKVVQRGIFRPSWPTWHPWKLGNYNSLETISHGGESDALQAQPNLTEVLIYLSDPPWKYVGNSNKIYLGIEGPGATSAKLGFLANSQCQKLAPWGMPNALRVIRSMRLPQGPVQ